MYSDKDLLLSNIVTRSRDNGSLVDIFLRIIKTTIIIKNGLEGLRRSGLHICGSEEYMIVKYIFTVRMCSENCGSEDRSRKNKSHFRQSKFYMLKHGALLFYV